MPVERTGETVVGADAATIDPAVALGPVLAAGLAPVAIDPLEDAARWAASGAMELTGRTAGPPLGAPLGAATALAAIGGWIEVLTSRVGRTVRVDAPALLAERAAIAGFRRHGDRSCGGGTRLLRCADGWLAVTLARDDDIAAIPAWLEVDAVALDPWATVEAAVRVRRGGELLTRAHLLGIPASRLGEAASPTVHGPAVVATLVSSGHDQDPVPTTRRALRVVDLSSLWAGPLCGHLLQLAGADVVKVESTARPDGARRGPAAFFDLLHHGQRAVALDLTTREGQRVLLALINEADVVIEGSRPRALRQMGIDAVDVLRSARPTAWVSITGAGREGGAADRVSFGDDAAVAGGLVASDDGGPLFCADAVADPIAGLLAAASVVAALSTPGAWLLDVALAHAASFVAGARITAPGVGVPAAPRARTPAGRAPAHGAHTRAVLSEWGVATR